MIPFSSESLESPEKNEHGNILILEYLIVLKKFVNHSTKREATWKQWKCKCNCEWTWVGIAQIAQLEVLASAATTAVREYTYIYSSLVMN